MTRSKYYGHKTMADGTRVPLSEAEAAAIWNKALAAQAKAEADMPAATDALREMQRAKTRLRTLGWRDGVYCPKDGSAFAVIQFGSTGIFEGVYHGEWSAGRIYFCDCFVHPDGMLFKPLVDLTDAERARLAECMGHERAAREHEIQSLLNMDQEADQ